MTKRLTSETLLSAKMGKSIHRNSFSIRDWRIWVLLTAIIIAIIVVSFLPTITQNQSYHDFADKRAFIGIPNCFNVVSNVLFLVVSWAGLRSLWYRTRTTDSDNSRGTVRKTPPFGRVSCFIDPRERWPYFAFFLSVGMTSFGSAYYHLDPRDGTLLWDRIPMASGFLALLAATAAERIDVKLGTRLLVPLVALGLGTVAYWSITQNEGHGDLRPYALVQFGSAFVMLVLVSLFPPRYTRGFDLIVALTIYAIAKIFEAADGPVFAWTGVVSGHTLKHITAAISAYWIARMLCLRQAIDL